MHWMQALSELHRCTSAFRSVELRTLNIVIVSALDVSAPTKHDGPHFRTGC